MKTCQYCLPSRRAARYEVVNGTATYTCAKHVYEVLHNAKSNVTVYPLDEQSGERLYTVE